MKKTWAQTSKILFQFHGLSTVFRLIPLETRLGSVVFTYRLDKISVGKKLAANETWGDLEDMVF